MQYDLKKLVEHKTIVIMWHGEPTKVLVDGESSKREVKTGDVLKVNVEQARRLFSYSPFWTLKGDKPIEQPYLNRSISAPEDKENKTNDDTPIEKMSKEQIVEKLKEIGCNFNDQAETEDLRMLLLEAQIEQEKKQADEEQKTTK